MKNLSKVMAVVLALLMAISSVSFAAFTDVPENASYGEAVSILNALGILKGDTDGAFRPDDTIKRSEFAAVVCRLLGLGEAGEGAKGQVVFTDVSGEHWASGYIALASQQGIVNGKGNGIFDPDADVKYEEAVKMIVAALGYTPMADTNGGYPGGYQIVAAQKGILAGVKGIQGQAASRSLVAQMCYNALEVPLMVQDGFGTDISFGYGDELLLNKLGVAKVEGAVVATSASSDDIDEDEVMVRGDRQVTAINGQASASRIKIDSDNALNANPDITDTFEKKTGYDGLVAKIYIADAEGLDAEVKSLIDLKSVMYILDANTEDATLVAIAPKGSAGDAVEFRSEDINDKKTDVDEGEVVVDVDGNDEEFEVAKTPKIYINGRTTVPYSGIAGLTIGTATKDNENAILKYFFNSAVAADVKLLNNDVTSDEYNVVYITAYKEYVVDQISTKNYTIIPKTAKDGKLVLDEENKDYRFEIVKDGAKVAFADIQVNDVISVAGGFDKTNDKELAYGTATITSQQVAGKVKSYSEEDGTITIGDQVYNYDSNRIEVGKDVKLGDEVTMYLSARNVLVGVDTTKSKGNLKYGFATKMAEGSGIDSDMQIRLMDTEGTWKTMKFASKVAVNTDNSKAIAEIDWADKVGNIGIGTTESKDVSDDIIIVNKVVGYEVNGDGDINKIYFTAETPNPDKVYSGEVKGSSEYREATEEFGKVLVSEATVIFSVDDFEPKDDDEKIIAVAEDDVSVAKIDALVSGDTYNNAFVLNVDEDNYASVIYGAKLVGAVNKAGAFYTIMSKTLTTNDEGDEGELLTGVQNGEEVKLFVGEDADIVDAKYDSDAKDFGEKDLEGELAKGDVIIFSKAANGDAKKIIRLLDASSLIAMKDVLDDEDNKIGEELNLDSYNNALVKNEAVEIDTFEAGGEEYTFIRGFVTDLTSKRISILADFTKKTNDNIGETFTVKNDATMAAYDAFYTTGKTSGKVDIADASDIDATFYVGNVAEKNSVGDIVFARVDGNSIVDAVIIKQYND